MMVYYDGGTYLEGGVIARYSSDGGLTWGDDEVIHASTSTHGLDNPEVVQLSDGTLLVCVNLRPYGSDKEHYPYHYEIGVMRKPVGESWSELNIIYQADTNSDNGCWEPRIIELPTGELEIYFANEAPYTDSDEQEISRMVSYDKGDSWSSAVRYCFSSGNRDGMPVPIIAPDNKLYTAIEDNSGGGGIFNITLIENEPTAGNTDITRHYSVIPEFRSTAISTGAPYLAVLGDDRVVLTGNTAYGRTTDDQVPFLAINQEGTYTVYDVLDDNPFEIPDGYAGVCNSVTTLSDGSILLFSNYKDKIYMMKGKLVESTDCD
jgi:hypothetical protein